MAGKCQLKFGPAITALISECTISFSTQLPVAAAAVLQIMLSTGNPALSSVIQGSWFG